jgi:hypothetical protein
MNSVPLYDATAPFVCTADDDEIPKRIAQVERMRAALDHLDRTEHAYCTASRTNRPSRLTCAASPSTKSAAASSGASRS